MLEISDDVISIINIFSNKKKKIINEWINRYIYILNE
jgi:hypothetical protein